MIYLIKSNILVNVLEDSYLLLFPLVHTPGFMNNLVQIPAETTVYKEFYTLLMHALICNV